MILSVSVHLMGFLLLQLYRELSKAPDPAAELASAVSLARKFAELQQEHAAQAKELAEYEEEFAGLKNQDVTIRRLEERIAELEEAAESGDGAGMAAREAELVKAEEAARRAAAEAEANAEARVRAAREEVESLQHALDSAQSALFEARRAGEEEAAALQAEADVAAAEADRATARAEAAERALAEATGGSSGGGGGDGDERGSSNAATRIVELETELARRDADTAALRGEVAQWEHTVQELREAHDEALARVQLQVADRDRKVGELQAELSSRPSPEEVDALRGKVRMLERLHFNVEGDSAGDGSHVGADAPTRADGGEDGIPEAVVRRVRQLDDTVTKLRREVAATKESLEQREAELEAARAQLAQRDELVARLEADLSSRVDAAVDASREQEAGAPTAGPSPGASPSSPARSPAAGAPGGMSSEAGRLMAVLSASSATPEGSGGRVPGRGGAHVSASARGAADVDAAMSGSLADILRSQRDRYKARLDQAEAEAEKLRRDVEEQRANAATLKQHNVQLFQKVRYLESFDGKGAKAPSSTPRDTSTRRSGSSTPGGAGVDVEGGAGGGGAELADYERPYSREFEDSVSPFAAFRKREQSRRYQRLSAADKITLGGGRLCMGSKTVRNFMLFYALALHLLVFVTLYHFTHFNHSHCERSK